MARINSKAKGSSFERDIVNRFKILFEDDGFMRTPHSGAQFGASNRHRMQGIDEGFSHQMCGDLVVPEKFPFSIECKAYKDLDFHNIINGSCTTLDEWIEQAEDDAQASDKEMLIVIKINNKGKYVCTHDLNYGPISLGSTSNVMRYQDSYFVYSYDLFESLCDRFDIVHTWNINKGKEAV
jgi:hypothetical protein